jgi:glycosyltransferase involved in cell wall biosynthesis
LRAEITCIIPVFNGEKYIVESIESALNQTHAMSRILVVNDGSEDNTLEVLKPFYGQIEILSKPHSGLSDTLNVGIRAATSEFIAFLDADDIWSPSKTEMQVQAIEHNDTDMCFCRMEQFYSPDLTEDQRKMVQLQKSDLKGYSKVAMIIRRSVFDEVGLFDINVVTGDFIEWYSRALSQKISHCIVDETLCKRRIHLSNFMRSEKSDVGDFTAILRNHLARMRKNQQTNN